ncbi:hypothetical protein ACFVU3_37785 [Streptomyces sp. NPDC058052]|uniref:hypothetical protein n=1 Tax=Streptomyces sp. NPDC058052 TaxID=3346316 RepID=UPI0036EF0C42
MLFPPAGSLLEPHPLLQRTVRDIANGSEGVLTAVTREWHGGRLLHIAHLRPAAGATWTTVVGNIRPTLRRNAPAAGAPGPDGTA